MTVCFEPAMCTNTIGSYTCVCPAGYESNGAQGCVPINECTISTPSCVNGMCVDGDNGYSCACDSGWEGPDCDVDVEECEHDPYPCDPNALCAEIPGSFDCTCNDGFAGDGQLHSDGTPGCVEVPVDIPIDPDPLPVE